MAIQTTKFDITGMSCAACSAAIERAVGKLPGVQKAAVNLLANSMVVEYDPALVGIDDIVAAVEKAGYGASPIAPKPSAATGGAASSKTQSGPARRDPMRAELSSMKRRLIVSFAFLLPLLYVSMGHMVGLPLPGFLTGEQNAASFALTQFLLTLPVVAVNRKFFTSGFRALWHRSPNMDSLIALGASASLAYGIFALYRIGWGLGHGDAEVVMHYMHELYFESAATILALITLGKTLEAYSKGRTGAAISALLDLAPKTALLLRDGEEVEVPVEELRPGDLIAVKPGARIPVDGVVTAGRSAVDESAITGESIPADKAPGDKLTGATVNSSGYLEMRAERVGEDTTLSQIIAMVEEAGASKAPIAQLADKISGVFVPIVMAIALVCFTAWMIAGNGVEFALSRAVTVLVISCPCALGLATPVAIMVGTGKGAKNGILYKNAEALETLCNVDTAVLDKTGTITEGKPRLADVLPFGCGEEQLLALAAGIEQRSEHPVARAITQGANQRGVAPLPIEDFEALSGLGLRGTILAPATNANAFGSSVATDTTGNGTGAGNQPANAALAAPQKQTILAGNARFMQENSIDLAPAGNIAAALAAQGKTPLYFAKNGQLAGLIAVADPPKAESAAAIAALRRRNVRAVMLTGDNRATAEAVRKAVGLDEAVAEVLPQDKEREVRALMEGGHKVAMVGDGINDAPALARADVGIAIGAGTDVAIESAGVVLVKSTLADAVTAVDLSRAVLRNIKQNLFWAFFYNIVGIPVAAGVLYPAFGVTLSPMLGAAAMSLSSVFVVMNALRLNLFKPKADAAAPKGRTAAPPPSAGSAHDHGHAPEGPPRPATQKTTQQEETTMQKIIHIEGMTCAHCKARVEGALNALPGVSATVDLEAKTAAVQTDGAASDAALRAAVEDAGYEVTGIE